MSTLNAPSTYNTLIGVTDEPLWEFGEPTEHGIEVYTAGDCWALAWHVAKITGGRLHVLGRWPDWCHVVVEVRPGVYLDANGAHDVETLEADWYDYPLTPVPETAAASLADYITALDAGFVYKHLGHGAAADFARLLINKHL